MPELCTIGYEGAAQAGLLEALLFADIQTLVDIRELPQSRKPGFSKTTLELALRCHGMQYVHLRALGTPRDIRYRRKVDHDQAAFARDFVEYLDTQTEAMQTLVARAERERCCLLCFEADPQVCHRWFVAERAVAMTSGSITVSHLRIGEAPPRH